MENFFKIRAEKQEHIVNAAFRVFGRQGFRKASIGDIAQEAGITKGMITYYFGSKKTLYMYLVEVSQSRLVKAMQQQLADSPVTDFFERLKIATDVQVAAVKEHPALISFQNSVYYETDPVVAPELTEMLTAEHMRCDKILLEGSDLSTIQPAANSALITKFVMWATDGFFEQLYYLAEDAKNINSLVSEFYQCIDLIKKTFHLHTNEGGTN